ncbi:DUF11 domain-containing protein [Crassaminicella indica]|uniref:DUF11 domain-containing protein n=1 Tax=Crassaminicella indica TaxID=2855394 RepID=A0ABX8RCT6_9CLOT|nr:DUF11 domain-containing protein [Crassaminicella indica]QXM06264.1 hypothetical protein KVH43_00005 [Crassaminicella indica]
MSISATNFILNLSPNPSKAVIGMNTNLDLLFSNTSTTERGYNLTLEATLPDGISFIDSSITPTSIINNPTGTITLQWINIKDLAPNEINYKIVLILKADENFRETGLPVPFDVPLTSIDIHATIDTLPRGNDDSGNEKIIKTASENFIPLRYDLLKSAPSKMPKGAGLVSPSKYPRWPYQYKLTIMNNSRTPSSVTLLDHLPNGVRYLGNLNVTGPDAPVLSNPTIIVPTGPESQDFVTLDWGSIELSANSVNTISFNAAIWDNYTVNGIENSGSKIPHRTPLENIATLDGLSGPIQSIVKTNAMDATINKSIDRNITDVGEINTYTLTYRINQYDNISSFVITDTIGNGQSYNHGSASIIPDSITVHPNGTTTLTWNLGLLITETTGNITFTTTVNTNYSTGNPVASGDTLFNNTNITGINQTTSTAAPDYSSANTSIKKPHIKKEILNYYYKDGTIKAFDVAAPLDQVEFRITYSSNNIKASQLNIEIDEYAPLNMGPLTASLPIIYNSTFPGPFSPFTVSPNGLRWKLGTTPGNNTWTATFKVPVKDIEFVGAKNNLAKLAGENTPGFAYSNRDQIKVNFGKPNIKFKKEVTGPNVNAIKAGETYTYTITISNPQNSEGTVVDAFEMDLTDIIPDDLTFNGIFNVIGTASYTTPIFSGQNVSMTIKKLAPDENLTFNFEVTVDSTIASGKILKNQAILQRPYSQPDRSYQYTGSPFKSSTTLKTEGIQLNKLITPMFAKIGDKVTYIVQATVPLGTTAYDIELIDEFQASTQSFILGSAKINNSSVIPSVSSGVVAFPKINFIDATTKEVLITYSFDVRIINGTHISPFIEEQINKATIQWNFKEGEPAVPVSISEPLQVRTPNLRGIKQQRNVTKNTHFKTHRLDYEVGDVIEYLISITNDGAEKAFDAVIIDHLEPFLSFKAGSIITTKGSASEAGGTITWNIPVLEIDETATLIFSVDTLSGVAAGKTILDNATYTYNTNNNSFGIEFGPDKTNTVHLISPFVSILKTSSISEGEIGDDITYSIKLTVPNGTIAYTPKIQDMLPLSQDYIGPASRQELPNPPTTITPISLNPITFDSPTIDASSGEKVVIYKFIARIVDSTHNQPFTEIQTNYSQIQWAIRPEGPLSRIKKSSINITAKTPNITVIKEQKKASDTNYTTNHLSALPNEEIHYRLTINSNGATTAYKVKVVDVLNEFFEYDRTILGPSPIITGNTIEWNIGNIDTKDTFIIEFAVKIKPGIGAGAQIPNQVKVFYDSNTINAITYHASSNKVLIDIPPLQFEKSADKSIAALGDEITYTLKVIIPDGVNAYNVVIKDTIPFCQEYKPSSWSPGTPIVSPSLKEIVFNESTSPLIGTKEYTFKTIVKCDRVEIQTNHSQISWNILPSGPQAPPISSFVDVTVKNPNIQVTKEQSIHATGPFTKDLIKGIKANDTIYYKITLENIGQTPAYNIITTDLLDNNLIYMGPVGNYLGTITPDPPTGNPNGTIMWTLPVLEAGSSTSFIFQVNIVSGFITGSNVINQASTKYDTSIDHPVTIGPILSNQVGFEFISPTISKTVKDDIKFLGDIITYTIEINIPDGGIAHDAQVKDLLPLDQSYVADSLRKNGSKIIPYSTSPLIFEAAKDLTGTIIYTFEAQIDSMSSTPQDKQTNEAILTWRTKPSSPLSTIADTTNVYVTNSDISISKAQRNFTADNSSPFTTNPIQVSVGDVIHYQFTVENLNPNYPIYNVKIKDPLNSLLKYLQPIEPFPPGIIIHTGEPQGGEVTWNIEHIPPFGKYRAIIALEILPGAGAQSTILNTSSATFSAVQEPPVLIYGPKVSNTLSAQLPSLQIEKNVSKTTVEIGEIIKYTLSLTVPYGTIAYNVIVQDLLPPQQIYIGEATKNGSPVFPTIDGQKITFAQEALIDASSNIKNIIYTFKARVIKGNTSFPYTETQINHVTTNWHIDPNGTPALPVTNSKAIVVNNPFFFIGKEQRNVTKKTAFDTNELAVEVGDILEFKLVAHNFGKASAYNVIITDILSSFDQYIEVVSISSGKVDFDSSSNTIIWTIDILPPQSVEFFIFKIKILGGVSAGGSDTNIATAFYDTNKATPITVGPFESNKVIHRYPNILITKTADSKNVIIGDIITYTVRFTLPNGTIALNGQFTDTLPIGQVYYDYATLNGKPIEPVEVNGQFIAFPIIPYSYAKEKDLTFTYQFLAKVISVDVNPITLIETQTNEAVGKWFLNPSTSAQPVNALKNIYATNSKIEIKKLQRNVSKCGHFTTEPIPGNKKNIIEYSITIDNTSPNTVYNIITEDNLSPQLQFISPISVPIGTLTHSNGTITWSIPSLTANNSVTAIFSVKIIATKTPIINYATSSFHITPTDPNIFFSNPSNITVIRTDNCTAVFTIGLNIKISTQKNVDLLIPTHGYCKLLEDQHKHHNNK